MSSPAISFVSEVIPDKKLQKTLIYRYYPPSDMKELILSHVKEHLKCDLEEYIIEVKVEVNLKKYDDNTSSKEHWYDKK
jgi:hypothetical protein